MRKLLFLRLAILACFLSTVGELPTRAQSDIPENTQTLTADQARTQLETESRTLKGLLNGINPEGLKRAVTNFVDAAQNPEDHAKLSQATSDLRLALKNARERARQQRKVFAEGDAVKAMEKAMEASAILTKSTGGEKNGSATGPSPQQTKAASANKNSETPPDSSESWFGYLLPIAGGVAALGLILLAVFGVLKLRAGFWAKLDDHVNGIVQTQLGGLKRRQDELGKQLVTIADEHKKASSRLESIEGGIQALGRRLRHGNGGTDQGAGVRQAFEEYSKATAQPVEPEFPTPAADYLNKMKRNSTVVKPDFQNGILINDIDGKGELVLIRDTSVADDEQPLFIVPRVTQFQTKQEFHSYYERYYDCQAPSAGDVWIIDPAIVSTVPGGWELREKGVLEVR